MVFDSPAVDFIVPSHSPSNCFSNACSGPGLGGAGGSAAGDSAQSTRQQSRLTSTVRMTHLLEHSPVPWPVRPGPALARNFATTSGLNVNVCIIREPLPCQGGQAHFLGNYTAARLVGAPAFGSPPNACLPCTT